MTDASNPHHGSIGVRSYVRYSGDTPPSEIVLNHHQLYQREGVSLPITGLTMLYGLQGARKVLGSLLQATEDAGETFVSVHGRVSIGEPVNRKIGLDDLDDVLFLCFPDRTKADLMDWVRDRWVALLEKHGLGEDGDTFPRGPSPSLHLLDELILEPELAHLVAIAYPVDTRVGVCRMVTVFKREAIEEVEALSVEPIELAY